MNLEQRVTKGFIVYIHSIDYDVVNKHLVIKLLKNPEHQQQIVRILTFYNIQNFSEELDKEDCDEDWLDLLIGLQQYPQKTGVQYLIRTEQRKIVFFTEVKPQVQEIGILSSATLSILFSPPAPSAPPAVSIGGLWMESE